MTAIMNRLFMSMAACLVAGIVTAAFVVFLGVAFYLELRNIASPAIAALATSVGAVIVIATSAYCASAFAKMQTPGAGACSNDVARGVSTLGVEAVTAIKGHPYQAAIIALALGFALGRKRGVGDVLMEEIIRTALR